MSLYDKYTELSQLDDVSFIAGTDYTIEFPVYSESGARQDITSMSAKWYLAPYGQPETTIAEIDCTSVLSSGSYAFSVEIPKEINSHLGGLYTQQIEITLPNGKLMRPVQGSVIIHKAINSRLYG